ncbi:MAG: multidrug effflux MFS transporter [Nannocystaceae bacterium]
MVEVRLHLILVGLAALTALSMDSTLPALPSMAAAFGVHTADVRPTIIRFVVGFAGGQLAFGPLSDRFGRRRPLLVALVVYLGASLSCVFAPSLAELTGWRGVQGFAAGGVAITFMSVARDLYRGRRLLRVLAWVGAGASVSPILASVVGAQLADHVGWRSVFGFLSLVSVGLLAWTVRGLPETLPAAKRTPLSGVVRGFALTLTEPRFLLPVAGHSFAFVGLFVFVIGGHELLMIRRGVSPTAFSFLFALNAAVFALVNAVVARRLRGGSLWHPSGLARFGSGLVVLGGLLQVAIGPLDGSLGIVTLMLALAVVTAGVALAMPATATLALQPFETGAARAAGLLGGLRFGVASLIGSLLAGWVPLLTSDAMATVQVLAGGLSLVALAAYARLEPGHRARRVPSARTQAALTRFFREPAPRRPRRATVDMPGR